VIRALFQRALRGLAETMMARTDGRLIGEELHLVLSPREGGSPAVLLLISSDSATMQWEMTPDEALDLSEFLRKSAVKAGVKSKSVTTRSKGVGQA